MRKEGNQRGIWPLSYGDSGGGRMVSPYKWEGVEVEVAWMPLLVDSHAITWASIGAWPDIQSTCRRDWCSLAS